MALSAEEPAYTQEDNDYSFSLGVEAGARDAKSDAISAIEDLIWRRTLLGKPHDQLDEILAMVEEL